MSTLQSEVEVIVRLRREQDTDGWQVTASLSDVPADFGHYGLDDGLRCVGGGVTRNMRQSLKALASGKPLRRPIYRWLPDTDGGAALWLDGKIRCSRCEGNPIFDLNDIDEHGVEAHNDEPERDLY